MWKTGRLPFSELVSSRQNGAGPVPDALLHASPSILGSSLLGSFSKFTGLSGLLKGETLQLRNLSGMLGAYGFLSPPGSFTVVSARVLNHLLGGRKSLTTKELIPAILSEAGAARSVGISRDAGWWFDPENCPECPEMAMDFFPSRWWRHCRLRARSSKCPSKVY